MTLRNPVVTVITPTYNGERFIGATIRSVLEQDFSDFEYLIVDDASTDGTERVIQEFVKADPRVRYFRLEKNTGQPAAPRNFAVRRANGKYIALLDHDDLWLPGKLSLQVSYLDRYPDVAVVHGNAWNVTGDPETPRTPYWKRPPHRERDRVYRKLLRGCCVIACTAVVRTECVHKAGLFAEEPMARFLPDDWLLWIKIARTNLFGYMDTFVALYRVHPESLTGSRRLMAESDYYLFDRYGREMGLSALSRRFHLSARKYQVAKTIYYDEERFPRKELGEAFRLNPLNLRILGFLARFGFQTKT